MKKLLTISLIVFMSLSMIVINTKEIKADTACTTMSTGECTISSEADLSAWASNNNDNVTGKLEDNITLTSEVSVSKIKTLDLNGKTIKAKDGFSGKMFTVTGELTIDDSTKSATKPYGDGAIVGKDSKDSYEENDYIQGFYIDGSNSSPTLTMIAGTIKNMYATPKDSIFGGAIFNYCGTVIINGGLITDCVAFEGGAICNYSNSANASVKINGGTIKNCDACKGGAIANHGDSSLFKADLIINGGTIDSCKASIEIGDHYSYGGAIYNRAEDGPANTTINGGTIKDCSSINYGGAIYNEYIENTASIDDALLSITDGEIKGCYAQWSGGAILNNGKTTIEDGTIDSCEANESGGAIENQGGLIISGGKISKCKSPYSAVCHYGDSFILNGAAKFNNTNAQGNKDDICVDIGKTITINDGFTQGVGDKIAIWTSTGNLPLSTNSYKSVVKGTYASTLDDLADIFISGHGQEYLVEDSVNNALNLKAVSLTTQANFDNGYTVDTNKKETTNPIKVSYQWYQSIIDKEKEINGAGSYSIGNVNFTVTALTAPGESGTYDPTNNEWNCHCVGDKNYINAFKISGLKKGQVLSFDYKTNKTPTYLFLTLRDDDYNYYHIYTGINSSGRYTALISKELEDKDVYVYVHAESTDGENDITIKNIFVKERQDAKAIAGATTATLTNAKQGADNFCRITFKNTDDNVTNYVDSFDVNFGMVSSGDNQKVNIGKSAEVKFKTDLEKTAIEVYVDSVSAETKLVSGTDYTIGGNNSPYTLTIDTNSENIPRGSHQYYIKANSKEGYETIIFTLTVQTDDPSTSTVDKSCEKVIGPTWHWNNTKGVCEEYALVRTNTR